MHIIIDHSVNNYIASVLNKENDLVLRTTRDENNDIVIKAEPSPVISIFNKSGYNIDTIYNLVLGADRNELTPANQEKFAEILAEKVVLYHEKRDEHCKNAIPIDVRIQSTKAAIKDALSRKG